MSAEVTQFEPPEGLFPHEAPYIMGLRGHALRVRVPTTAMFEAAGAGRVKYVPGSKKLAVHDSAVASTPYLDAIVAYLTGGDGAVARGINPKLFGPDLPQQRLVAAGWMDAKGKLTPAGEELRTYLEGYREYLRTAMANRLHVAAVEGREATEVAYAIGLGVIDGLNAHRAYMLRIGAPIDSTLARAYDFFGGRTSRQHAPRAGFDAFGRRFVILWCVLVAVMLLLYYLLEIRT